MSDAGRIDDSGAPLSEAVPVLDGVPNQSRLVHALGERRLDIISPCRRDTLKVRRCRRVELRWNEKFVAGQFGHVWAFEEHLEHVAEPAPVATAWGRGQADDNC